MTQEHDEPICNRRFRSELIGDLADLGRKYQSKHNIAVVEFCYSLFQIGAAFLKEASDHPSESELENSILKLAGEATRSMKRKR